MFKIVPTSDKHLNISLLLQNSQENLKGLILTSMMGHNMMVTVVNSQKALVIHRLKHLARESLKLPVENSLRVNFNMKHQINHSSSHSTDHC